MLGHTRTYAEPTHLADADAKGVDMELGQPDDLFEREPLHIVRVELLEALVHVQDLLLGEEGAVLVLVKLLLCEH